MNPNFPAGPRLRYAAAFQQQPDPLPRLPYQLDELCEVILLSSGTAFFASDHKQYAVQPGDVLICRPGARCALLPDPDGLCYTSLLFELPPYPEAPQFPSEDVISCGPHMTELLSLSEMLCSDSILPAVQSHLLSALLLQIGSGTVRTPTQIIPPESAPYIMACFIDEHYTEDIFLSDIAGSVHLTTSHSIHVFKPEFGISPVQFLGNRRIGQAQHLLLTSELSASHIASEVGISNINYFYTVFKKLVGLSPASYRTHFSGHVTQYSA